MCIHYLILSVCVFTAGVEGELCSPEPAELQFCIKCVLGMLVKQNGC